MGENQLIFLVLFLFILFLKNKKSYLNKAIFLLIPLMLLTACASPNTYSTDSSSNKENTEELVNKREKLKEKESKDKTEEEKNIEKESELGERLTVHYINLGQGDSTFIELPNDEKALIDGGKRSNGQTVLDYLAELKIEKIDYLIATHPHEDHIGGLVKVVENYDIGKIYMPDKEHTTIVFEDLLLAIQEKGYSINKAKAGDFIIDEGNLSMNIIAPEGITGDNLNDYSVANKLIFGETSFLFTGDAEKKSEENMVNSNYDLTADVLKVGHHGGDTSSISSFLDEVNPDYGVISAGRENQYGHPHPNVMERLSNHSIEVFRTDKDGTIIASTDGETIDFNKKATEIAQSSPDKEEGNISDQKTEVYRTDTGSKYHRSDCYTLEHSKVAIPLDEAKEEGLVACGICKPPK